MGGRQLMNKKILGILVCTLLMSTVLTVAGQANVEQISNGPNVTLFDDDVPIWEVGYSWTYSGELNVADESMALSILLNEASFCVVDDSGGSYEVAFGGDVGGEFAVVDPSIAISSEDITGSLFLSQSKLGVERIDLSMSGTVELVGIPIPVEGDVEITVTYQETRDLIDFPMSVGKTWAIPSTPISIDILITIFGFIERTFQLDQSSMDWTAECTSRENVSIGSHTYDVYNISYEEGLWAYYAPSVGNIVKLRPFDDEVVDFSLEMKATSYPGPDNPLKPETPDGPTGGSIGQSYEYTTRAVDPNDDQIMYIWDWTGDMIPDEWTGFHDSNINITTSHTWTEMGNYEIRVKARNSQGLESDWSDPLPVTMPRNRLLTNIFFMRLLERFPNAFPLLRHLLGV